MTECAFLLFSRVIGDNPSEVFILGFGAYIGFINEHKHEHHSRFLASERRSTTAMNNNQSCSPIYIHMVMRCFPQCTQAPIQPFLVCLKS